MQTSIMELGTLPKLANPDLQRVTNEIWACASSMVQARKVLASKLAEIEQNAIASTNKDNDVVEWCAEFDGETPLKRFEAYGLEVIGLKRTQLKEYARIGRVCLDGNGNSLLIESGKDFSLTQLRHISQLDTDTAKALVASGEVSPDMTVEDIKGVVVDHKPGAKVAKQKREEAKAKRERKQRIEQGEIVAAIEVKIVANRWFVFANGIDITNERIGRYLVKTYKSIHAKREDNMG